MRKFITGNMAVAEAVIGSTHRVEARSVVVLFAAASGYTSSGTISIAPQGHSATQTPQPLQ